MSSVKLKVMIGNLVTTSLVPQQRILSLALNFISLDSSMVDLQYFISFKCWISLKQKLFFFFDCTVRHVGS